MLQRPQVQALTGTSCAQPTWLSTPFTSFTEDGDNIFCCCCRPGDDDADDGGVSSTGYTTGKQSGGAPPRWERELEIGGESIGRGAAAASGVEKRKTG